MQRILCTLGFLMMLLLPEAGALAQTYQDYVPPIYQTGNGFWYRDQAQDYDYRYMRNDEFNRTDPFATQRYYRAHRNVILSVSDNRDPVHAGDQLTYFITVQNPINTVASVDITAFLDPNTDFRQASNDGERTGDRVRWNDVVVYGYTSRTLAVTVRVNSDVYEAEQLQFRALADQVSATEITKVEDYQRRVPAGPTSYSPNVVRTTATDYNLNVISPAYYEQRTVRETTTSERYPDRDFQVTLRTRGDGSDVIYTLTVENHTNRTLKDVDVTHQFNTPVDTMEIVTAAGGADKGDRITWDLGYLAPYEYRVLEYRVRFMGVSAVHSAVNAISRDPALKATMGDTVRIGATAGTPYVYNYDAVHFPQAGIADLFFSAPDTDGSSFLSPVAERGGLSELAGLLLVTTAALGIGAVSMRVMRRAAQS